MAALSPPVLSHSYHSLTPNLHMLWSYGNTIAFSTETRHKSRRNTKKQVSCLFDSSRSSLHNGVSRRNLMFLGLSSSLYILSPNRVCGVEDLKMDLMVDYINAYSYLFPTELPSKKFVLKWVESRTPERYSSAAPLSPNARLRIVSERVDFSDNLVISVSIGPPNSLLQSNPKSTWSAKDVADSVLAEKSAMRVSSTQRMDESSVVDTHSSLIDGEPYWYFEYLVRKSPTKSAQGSNLYRHFVASTAERDGYLYSLSASTLSKQWEKAGPLLQKTTESFRLLPTTENYVPPYKDPWRFW